MISTERKKVVISRESQVMMGDVSRHGRSRVLAPYWGTVRVVRWKARFSQHERLGVFEILRLGQRVGKKTTQL